MKSRTLITLLVVLGVAPFLLAQGGAGSTGSIEGEVVGTGRGASKKAAEQVAAREALEKLR